MLLNKSLFGDLCGETVGTFGDFDWNCNIEGKEASENISGISIDRQILRSFLLGLILIQFEIWIYDTMRKVLTVKGGAKRLGLTVMGKFRNHYN